MIHSATFWLALVAAVAAYWLVPARARMAVLAAASLGYLASLEPVGVAVLVGFGSVFYLTAHRPARGGSRWIVRLAIAAVLGYLVWFKYVPPLLEGVDSRFGRLAIPLGISYFTFKLIHYAVEAGRGNITERDPFAFFAWLLIFPAFTAGPIERYDHFLANRAERFEARFLVEGGTRIVHGLVKKLALGEVLLYVARRWYAGDEFASIWVEDFAVSGTAWAWGWCVLGFLTIYIDFSAYSDIAIGASRLFGIRLQENFRWPILATNISAFWSRWHMSLSDWCKTYVYLPTLGLTRNPWLAVFATFVSIGLWHEGSWPFVAWGLYHASGVAVSQAWGRFARRRGWRAPGLEAKGRVARLVGGALTFAFVSGSFALTTGAARGDLGVGLAVLAKLVGIDVDPR